MSGTVRTIGYEGATPDGVLGALKAADVRTVADIRAVARSRKPGFAKTRLAASLEAAGIGYWHLPELGTPAEGRALVRAGRPAAMKPIFLRQLATTEAQAALAMLAERVARESVCLLCFEADPAHCHRTLVAEALSGRLGLDIHHLHAEPAP